MAVVAAPVPTALSLLYVWWLCRMHVHNTECACVHLVSQYIYSTNPMKFLALYDSFLTISILCLSKHNTNFTTYIKRSD